MSLAELKEAPDRSLVLLAGPPGAGKSTFCCHVVVDSVAADRPVIFVTTERTVPDIVHLLREGGLGESMPGMVSFVDAFSETVGIDAPHRPDTVSANCINLNSLGMAIARLQERAVPRGIVLVLDSLTSPYLFSGAEVVKFMRLFLSKFAAEGNSVLAVMDEGSGKREDLGAMMSAADGIIKMEVEDGSRFLNVVKHPLVKPTRIEYLPPESTSIPFETMDLLMTKHYEAVRRGFQTSMRPELGDFVNVFWRSFAFWSGMLWDPERFPTLVYELTKEITTQGTALYMEKLPWYKKVMHKLMPHKPSHSAGFLQRKIGEPFKHQGGGTMEYLTQTSKPDEHHVRIHEGASCWGLENVGAPLCHDSAAYLAGLMKSFDQQWGEGRDWNAFETACVGQGSPYCEFKIVPGEVDELQGYLTALDEAATETIADRLMTQAKGYIKAGSPLGDRPTFQSGIHIHSFSFLLGLPAQASERYRMALRMAGAVAGKRLADHLSSLGLSVGESMARIADLLTYCNVGKVSIGETVKIRENCESFGMQSAQPSCFFTTGFLNGLFSALTNGRVSEAKCIAMGDPYCEWEVK